MFNIILAWSLAIVAILAGLRLWRWADTRSANAAWTAACCDARCV
jgi:hypothetical protein